MTRGKSSKKVLAKVTRADLREFYGKLLRNNMARLQNALDPCYKVERALHSVRRAVKEVDEALAELDQIVADQSNLQDLKLETLTLTQVVAMLDNYERDIHLLRLHKVESEADVDTLRKIIKRTLETEFWKGEE